MKTGSKLVIVGDGEFAAIAGALDLIFQRLIHDRYRAEAYFDFGISHEDDGRYPNAGLIQNTESCGARAVVFDCYSIDLSASDQAG